MSTPAGMVQRCPNGHGSYLALTVARRLVRTESVDAAWKAAFWEAPVAGCRCPGCGRAMSEVAVGGLRLDVCRRCQALWLDREDLAGLPPPTPTSAFDPAMEERARIARARAAAEALQRRAQEGEPIGDAPDQAWKQAVGSLGFPVEIGEMATRNRPWFTWGLCGVVLLLGLVFIAGDLAEVVREWGFIPEDAFRHGGLTVITSFFIHGGVLHLLGNLWFLWMTGDNVEDDLGPWRFLFLVLAAALAGDLVHLLGDPRGTLPCVGASGGISGVMGAYVMRFPRAQIGMAWNFGQVWVRLPAWAWFGLWIGGQALLVCQQVRGFTNVSALAHLGGVAAGAFLAWWWGRDPATGAQGVRGRPLTPPRRSAG